MASSMPTGASDRALNRRQLLKVGAWSAPALAIAVALPSASASEPVTQASVTVPATVTPVAGGGNRFALTINTVAAQPVTVTGVMTVTPINDTKGRLSDTGTWDLPSGATGATATIVKVASAAATALSFEFEYKSANANARYSYSLLFTWGPNNEFSAMRTGTF